MTVSLTSESNGLPRLELSHPSGARAELYLHGAHLTSWVPAGGREALFLSREAIFRPDAQIRGGVPVVFPQFASNGPLPKHGFARVQPWEWVGWDAGDGSTRATLRLVDSEATRALWPHRFEAELEVELARSRLGVRLSIRNTDAQPFSFTGALHTYLRVQDIDGIRVRGLQGTRYWDKTDRETLHEDGEPELRIDRQVDRVYLDAPRRVEVVDEGGGRTLAVHSDGFADVVVWNPWAELAASLPDLGDEEYREMVCVEAAQVAHPVQLGPGETWRGAQWIELD